MPSKIIAGVVAASTLLTAFPAVALTADATLDARTQVRMERCRRFGEGDDYQRCVRLIQRGPQQGTGSTTSADTETSAALGWKWTNILNRIEAKLQSMVKFVSVMAKAFCRDQTDDTGQTMRECMTTMKAELQKRVAMMIDVTFRTDPTN